MSAVAQYVEQIPTDAGSQVLGSRGKKAKLSRTTLEDLKSQGGRDQHALETIATSTELGAPTARSTRKTPARRRTTTPARSAEKPRRPRATPTASAATTPASSSAQIVGIGSGRLIGTVLAVALATLAIMLASRRRRAGS